MDPSDSDDDEARRNQCVGRGPDGEGAIEARQYPEAAGERDSALLADAADPDGAGTASRSVPTGLDWTPARSRLPSLRSNLSVIAAAAKLLIFIGLVAILYFGRPVFVPLAVAVLLAFILAPLVRVLHRWHLGRLAAIGIVVLTAFLAILGLGMILAAQVTHLAAALPQYQDTLARKISGLRGMAGGGALGRAAQVLRDLMTERAEIAEQGSAPIAVQIHQPIPAPVEVIQTIMSPLLEPLLTTGIIVVFVIFFLVQREDLRDRLIRLAGSTDLHRTTVAIDDAGHRLSRYLLTQTVLNGTFGVIIGSGLSLIGVLNPLLWGILAALLRFIPYVGVFIAAGFPLALAAAVDPGWTTVAWTAALFLTVELVIGQVLEPLLYGQSTGVSPVAVVVAAMFWTWLWGPVGLLLSTPLTVCLDVLGRHVDRLRFLDILLGAKPALSPAESFYHRILSGNCDEEFEQAERMLKTRPLSSFYDEVAIEGLRLAAIDAHRGALDVKSLQKIRAAVGGLVTDLSHLVDVMPSADAAKAFADASKVAAATDLAIADQQDGGANPPTVLCIPGPSPLDEVAANILAHVLRKHGLGVRVEKHELVQPGSVLSLDEEAPLVCLSYIDVGDAAVRARAAIRRVQRQVPNATVVVGLWGPNKDDSGRDQLKPSHYASSFSEAAQLCVKGAQLPAPARAGAGDLDWQQPDRDNPNKAVPIGAGDRGGADRWIEQPRLSQRSR